MLFRVVAEQQAGGMWTRRKKGAQLGRIRPHEMSITTRLLVLTCILFSDFYLQSEDLLTNFQKTVEW
jgi:hypothetical protein